MSNNIKNCKKLNSRTADLNQVQNNVEEVLTPVINSAIIDGVLLKDLCLIALKPNLIKHKLGRTPLGYVVIRKRADSRIWDVQDHNIMQLDR